MHNLIIPAPPPSMESFAPELCFCGRKTVEYHEFWFCSSQCARLDSLRSLDDPQAESHYRKVVRSAYARAGVPELYPHRIAAVDQLHHGSFGQRSLANAPPRVLPPMKSPHQWNIPLARRNAHDLNMREFPTLSQVTGRFVNKKAAAGEALVAEKCDRPRFQGFPNVASGVRTVQGPRDHTFEEISLDVIPLQEHVPARSLSHAPQPSDGLKKNIGKSVAALLNVGRSRKDKEGENPERVFGHPVDTLFVPMVRKESLPTRHQRSPPSAIPVQKSKALRRSASCAGWYNTPPCERDTVMHIIKEMRGECPESFDPKSLFQQKEDY